MTGRSKSRYLYLRPESSYKTFAADGGATMIPCPFESLGYPEDGLELLPTATSTGGLYDTPPEVGMDNATIDFAHPIIGLSSRVGDGVNPSTVTDDWLDMLLLHMFGETTDVEGDGCAVGSTTTNLQTDGDIIHAVGDLLPVYRGGLTVARTQMALISAANSVSDYDIDNVFAVAPPDVAVIQGHRRTRFSRGGGATLGGAFIDDNMGTYDLRGGRVSSWSVAAEAGKRIMGNVQLRFAYKEENAAGLGSLPATVAAPATTTCRLTSSPVWFNDTFYGTSRVEVNWGFEVAPVLDANAADGRAGDEVIRPVPTVTITPLRTDDALSLKRNLTRGPLIVQLGAGNDSVTGLGGMAFAFDQAGVEQNPSQDDNGHARLSITFKVYTPRTGRPFATVVRY